MNRPDVQTMNGTAHRRSFLYRPGEMKPQICHRIIGEATKIETTNGALIQIVLNCSIGVMAMSTGLALIVLSAEIAGSLTNFQISGAKYRQATKQIANPTMIRISRARNSSRCSRKDMRTIPSSSGSSSSSLPEGGVGVGGFGGAPAGFGGGPGVITGFGFTGSATVATGAAGVCCS